jgi:hypothetical protein
MCDAARPLFIFPEPELAYDLPRSIYDNSLWYPKTDNPGIGIIERKAYTLTGVGWYCTWYRKILPSYLVFHTGTRGVSKVPDFNNLNEFFGLQSHYCSIMLIGPAFQP